MARNGSGAYNLPAGNPVVTGTTISSTWANNTLNDIGTALTQSIASDGQTTPTNNLPMGGNAHTGVGNATVRNMYSSAGQVQDGTFNYLTSVSGSNVITATANLGMSAYVAGQSFSFLSASANTGATTLNINAIGAKAITKDGTITLTANDIPTGSIVNVVYDGTQFQLVNTPNVVGPKTSYIASLSLTSNVVTINTTTAHGIAINDNVTVTAVTNTVVNGSYTVASVPTSTSFTYALTNANITATVDTGTVVNNSYLNLAINASGILPIIHGGTGVEKFTQNAVIVGDGTNVPTGVLPSTNGNLLTSTVGATVTAGSFVIGTQYTILTVGTTSFTAIGASSNTAGVVFTATGVGSGDGTATTNVWTSAIPAAPPALSTASGTAPSYANRAWVNFNGDFASITTLTGTYVRLAASTTVTVTATAHGQLVGSQVYLDFTSGTALDGAYVVTTVADANTFTITTVASTATSGNVSLRRCAIRASGNVSSVTYNGAGDYSINFTTPIQDANFCLSGAVDGWTGGAGTYSLGINTLTANYARVTSIWTNGGGNNTAFAPVDATVVTAQVIR